MANFSLSTTVGLVDYAEDVFTVDTQAPNAGDVELRVNLTNVTSRKQVLVILEAIERRLEGARFGNSDLQAV